MKLVTFARAQLPFGVGDTRLVPDELAERLKAEGVVSSVEGWPAAAGAVAVKPKRPTLSVGRPVGAVNSRMAR